MLAWSMRATSLSIGSHMKQITFQEVLSMKKVNKVLCWPGWLSCLVSQIQIQI